MRYVVEAAARDAALTESRIKFLQRRLGELRESRPWVEALGSGNNYLAQVDNRIARLELELRNLERGNQLKIDW